MSALALTLWIAGTVVALLAIWLPTQFVLVPYIRLELRRKASRAHTPQPEEVWVQDEAMLYIDAVGPTGVELLTFDGKTLNRWKDTWPEWQQRLRVRTVWFTGVRRPLGPH